MVADKLQWRETFVLSNRFMQLSPEVQDPKWCFSTSCSFDWLSVDVHHKLDSFIKTLQQIEREREGEKLTSSKMRPKFINSKFG